MKGRSSIGCRWHLLSKTHVKPPPHGMVCVSGGCSFWPKQSFLSRYTCVQWPMGHLLSKICWQVRRKVFIIVASLYISFDCQQKGQIVMIQGALDADRCSHLKQLPGIVPYKRSQTTNRKVLPLHWRTTIRFGSGGSDFVKAIISQPLQVPGNTLSTWNQNEQVKVEFKP